MEAGIMDLLKGMGGGIGTGRSAPGSGETQMGMQNDERLKQALGGVSDNMMEQASQNPPQISQGGDPGQLAQIQMQAPQFQNILGDPRSAALQRLGR